MLGGLRGEDSNTELCCRGSLGQSPHYVWSKGFGLLFAGDIRRQRVSRMRGFRHWRWHLNEMYV